MAELEIKNNSGHSSIHKKRLKASTRVDLTPMVDLGFLLITFFVFTTTVSQSTSLNLNMPKDTKVPGTETLVPASGALTLLLGKDNLLFYYFGRVPDSINTTTYKAVRDIILEKKKQTPPKDFFIIIKPDKNASYGNVVNILDEMNIDNVASYAMDDLSPEESVLIQKREK